MKEVGETSGPCCWTVEDKNTDSQVFLNRFFLRCYHESSCVVILHLNPWTCLPHIELEYVQKKVPPWGLPGREFEIQTKAEPRGNAFFIQYWYLILVQYQPKRVISSDNIVLAHENISVIFCPVHLTNTCYSTALFQVRSASARVGLTRRRRSERRVTFMVVTIVLVFILCWLPFFTTNIVNLIDAIPEANTTLYFFFVILTYVNSCANPFLYGFLSNFRQSFEKVLCFHKSNNNAPSRKQRAGDQSPPMDTKSPILIAQCGEEQNGQAQNREVRPKSQRRDRPKGPFIWLDQRPFRVLRPVEFLSWCQQVSA